MRFKNIRKIVWKDVRDQVLIANKAVTSIIDKIPEKEHPSFYLASYPFGELMIEQGLARVPHNNEFHFIKKASLPNDILSDLDYANVPMLIGLNKASELFLGLNHRTYPLHLFAPGKILGLWPILDTEEFAKTYHRNMWNLAAGIRTIFMLPKVMDYGSHSKMQRQLQLTEAYPPHNLFDQGPVFADIARSAKMECDWQHEVLFFGKGWAEGLKSGKWPELHRILLQREWNDSLSLRNHMSIETIWQVLAQAQAQTRLKPNTYVIDTVKHLINIAVNTSVGFTPLANNDETFAPVTCIQKAYLEYYNLKQYIPTLLAPAYLQGNAAVYYSFLCPTLLSLSPNHNFRNTLEDERNIKHILELFQTELQQYDDFQHILPANIQFDFFHFEADPIYNIQPIEALAKADPYLSTYPADPSLIFCENGPFLRACVKIHCPSNIR